MRATAFTILALGLTAALAAGQAPPPVVAETTATAIPGVIAAGTKVEVIKSGFSGTEGPISLPDGSLIFTETQANRITRIDKDNNTSTADKPMFNRTVALRDSWAKIEKGQKPK